MLIQLNCPVVVCDCVVFACRVQCEVKLQVQQLSDSQHLLQSLRVELQVYEKIKTEAHKHNGTASCFVFVPKAKIINRCTDATTYSLCGGIKARECYMTVCPSLLLFPVGSL